MKSITNNIIYPRSIIKFRFIEYKYKTFLSVTRNKKNVTFVMGMTNNRFISLLVMLILLPSCVKTAPEGQNPFTQDFDIEKEGVQVD